MVLCIDVYTVYVIISCIYVCTIYVFICVFVWTDLGCICDRCSLFIYVYVWPFEFDCLFAYLNLSELIVNIVFYF